MSNRYTKYIKKPKDITAIKINENELNDIIYLKYDSNYKENGYSHYINNDILNIGYPNIDGLSSGTGKLKEIMIMNFIIIFLLRKDLQVHLLYYIIY